ncbi:25S rRNA (adenine645-N1)-methyltransferase [Dispira parvispora]|uniref:Ribosomal RNA-processing protein 8 n=1 Tax=Dispira parvispora TaxID=1520584 RepID=A0A9W8AQ12_9FUNG|nr:25S rRNA (adenine645-N1)-methyltransferase [Dispira parvispora]
MGSKKRKTKVAAETHTKSPALQQSKGTSAPTPSTHGQRSKQKPQPGGGTTLSQDAAALASQLGFTDQGLLASLMPSTKPGPKPTPSTSQKATNSRKQRSGVGPRDSAKTKQPAVLPKSKPKAASTQPADNRKRKRENTKKPTGKPQKDVIAQLESREKYKSLLGNSKASGHPHDRQSDKCTDSMSTDTQKNQPASVDAEDKTSTMTPLQRQMAKKLAGARFRHINEQLYTTPGHQSFTLFQKQPEIFHDYHRGFRSQVESWPVNPVDVLIDYIRQQPQSTVVADMGCGEAKIAQSVTQRIHSFDLVAANDHITACDIAHTPLEDNVVDIVVFCLALMGTNYLDFLREAHRICKVRGKLLIAEVVSRFTDIDAFVKLLDSLGFALVRKDDSNKMFTLLELVKLRSRKQQKNNDLDLASAPSLLKPCIYKRR